METRLDRVRKIVCIITAPIIGVFVIYLMWMQLKSEAKVETVVEKHHVICVPKVVFVKVPIYIPEAEEEEIIDEMPLDLTQGEQDLLEQIAMAEAEGEGATGMALVMRVVLNRAELDGLPLDEVIYKPEQFATDSMGAREPSEECHKALAMIIDGWDESQGALFFSPNDYSKYGEPLFQYGNHYFSR